MRLKVNDLAIGDIGCEVFSCRSDGACSANDAGMRHQQSGCCSIPHLRDDGAHSGMERRDILAAVWPCAIEILGPRVEFMARNVKPRAIFPASEIQLYEPAIRGHGEVKMGADSIRELLATLKRTGYDARDLRQGGNHALSLGWKSLNHVKIGLPITRSVSHTGPGVAHHQYSHAASPR